MSGRSEFQKELDSLIGLAPEEGEEEQQEVIPYDFEKEKVVYAPKESAVTDPKTGDTVEDYIHGRTIIYGLLERGTTALDGAMRVAAESEHPRAYEVASTIMKQVGALTKDLMEVHKLINEGGGNGSSGGSTGTPKPQIINNKQINVHFTQDVEETPLYKLLDELEDDGYDTGPSEAVHTIEGECTDAQEVPEEKHT